MSSTCKNPLVPGKVAGNVGFPVAGRSESVTSGISAIANDTGITNLNLLKRLALILAGLFFVLLGAFGVFLPGLPTAGPLILASICLTKSSPWLEQRLVRSRFFSAFHQYLDGGKEMPLRARVFAIAVMWISISISSVLMILSERVSYWIVGLTVLAGVIGTVFIARYGKKKSMKIPE